MNPSTPLFFVACVLACTPAHEPDMQPATSSDPQVEQQPAPTQLLVGRWRMIAEESGDEIEGIYQQQHRLLTLAADQTFISQNYVERHEGPWQLEGTTLTLGKQTAQLLSVDAEQLQLIEDLPEIYQREGPPRKVKITYRRIREDEFGPMLGARPRTAEPKAGRYAASYQFRMHKLPTMEIAVDHSVDGRARIELASEGSATGCFGVSTHERSSISKYASDDGQHHSNQNDSRLLLGFRGTWAIVGGHALVRAEQTWRDSCTDPNDPYKQLGPLELACRTIAANELLPSDVLACRIVEGLSQLHEIAINPADTERAGPYTMQHDPMGHLAPDMGRPWLLLGATALQVKSEDDSRDMSPKLGFVAQDLPFVESNYVNPPP